MKNIKLPKPKLTRVMSMHYLRLVTRSTMFLLMLGSYVYTHFFGHGTMLGKIEQYPPLIWAIWLMFMFEMTLRFFPSGLESPGCQKQFSRNYIRTGRTEIVIQDNHGVVFVALLWVILNGFFGYFRMSGVLDDDFMLLLSCFYSVCDLICILFFCPFQSWFFRNRCCTTCRIYNWDYAMMFTPLFFVPRIYSLTLLILAVGLMLRWEITFFRSPERFSENTNDYLTCKYCTEKLCRHKKQLIPLWKRIDALTKARIERLKGQLTNSKR